MDFNSTNKNNGKRKAQSIQDMINAPSQNTRSGLGRSGYTGPKKGADRTSSISSMGGSFGATLSGHTGTMDLSGINVTDSERTSRWANSNEGMPKEKRPRVKSDVPNPMRGNLLKGGSDGEKSGISPSDFLRNATASMDDHGSNRRDSGSSHRYSYDGPVKRKSGYVPPAYSGPLDEYGWIIFSGLLTFCVLITMLVSGLKPRNNTFIYPLNIYTMSGVINNAYEHALGIYTSSNTNASTDTEASAGTTASLDTTDSSTGTKTVEAVKAGDLNSFGKEGEAVTLDDGSKDIGSYTKASSHAELVSQIESALAANDVEFVGAKLAYEDETTGSLLGYPGTVVSHFCQYMSTNSDKRTLFISNISGDDYSAQNGDAYLIKIPIMKFTVKMGESTDTFVLDNTVVSVTGFSDQIVNGNQNAAIYPLLPCMYTVTLTNNAWPTPSQSQEIEATLGEGNLEIKVGL